MSKRFRLALLLIAIIAGAGIMLWQWQNAPTRKMVTINGVTVPPVPMLNAEDVDQGRALYSQYCASCHGAELEGVSNWKKTQPDGTLLPPPHDSSGHTWHHSDTLLLKIITEGGQPENGNMPAFGGILSEDEMRATLTFIKSSWEWKDREFQWWITASQDNFYE